MKSLLVVVRADNVAPVLEAALLVARRFSSHVVGMRGFGSEFADTDDQEIGVSIAGDVNRMPERVAQASDRARGLFWEFMKSRRVPAGGISPGEDGPDAFWLERYEHQAPIVGAVGRAYELIVVEQPRSATSVAGITFEEALFESGRPVLLVPKSDASRALGEIIAIAWNGSAETAQTVALGMPFLERARRVVIVAVEPQQMPEPGPTGAELARALEQHRINVSLRTAVGRQKAQGESFLREATAAGADLLLKGAYTRSRLRQMIFGGATRHIITESQIPVLMAR